MNLQTSAKRYFCHDQIEVTQSTYEQSNLSLKRP